jgi:hypothetical protein
MNSPVKQNLVYLVTRAAIVMGTFLFAAGKGTAYLAARFGVSIHPLLYLVIVMFAYGIAAQLVLVDLIKELRRRRNLSHPPWHQDSISRVWDGAQTVHRNHPFLLVFEIGFALDFLLGTVLHKPNQLLGWVMAFGSVVAMLVIILFTLRYSVAVTNDGLRITGLMKSKYIRRSEINNACVVPAKLRKYLVLTLRDGRKIAISSWVTNFKGLLAALSGSEPA